MQGGLAGGRIEIKDVSSLFLLLFSNFNFAQSYKSGIQGALAGGLTTRM